MASSENPLGSSVACLVLSSDFLPQHYTSAEELWVLTGSSLAHGSGDARSLFNFKYKLLSGDCDLGGRKVLFRLSMQWRHDSF